ncbi:MAG: heme-binding protein [Actinomycetia bacterium]|nr:heme-binding protein [Actinomycetes bacterium]MCH9767772.1 heme-binding protein [Actinomycetes bacterium]
MLFSATNVRRAVTCGLGGGAVVFGLLSAAPMASAEPQPPNCTAGDFSGTAAGVSAASAAYLFTHPEVNAFFTGLHGAPANQIEADVDEYLLANPQVLAELTAIRQPLADLKNRCGIIYAPDAR